MLGLSTRYLPCVPIIALMCGWEHIRFPVINICAVLCNIGWSIVHLLYNKVLVGSPLLGPKCLEMTRTFNLRMTCERTSP